MNKSGLTILKINKICLMGLNLSNKSFDRNSSVKISTEWYENPPESLITMYANSKDATFRYIWYQITIDYLSINNYSLKLASFSIVLPKYSLSWCLCLGLTDCLNEILIILSSQPMNFNTKARKRIAFTPIMLSTILFTQPLSPSGL